VTSAGCLPADMAENDLYEWNLALQDTNNGLAKTGKISYAAPIFTIAITWGESRDDNRDKSADPDLTFTTDFQL
jgi:type IV pilus assembly protein PilV